MAFDVGDVYKMGAHFGASQAFEAAAQMVREFVADHSMGQSLAASLDGLAARQRAKVEAAASSVGFAMPTIAPIAVELREAAERARGGK